MYLDKTFNFESMLNMRDLGGYLTPSGQKTKYGVFIRSDAPYQLNKIDLQELVNKGFTTVIDFRTKAEIEKKPCLLNGIDGVSYYNIPMLGGDKYPESEELIAPGYFNMIEDKETIYKIMKVIAKSRSSVFYHCSAGKDRTGVISALLLALAGVGKDDIVEDYFVSADNIKSLIDEILQKNPHLRLLENRREYMADFLNMVEKKYGSVDSYLLHIGISKSEIDIIRKKLID